MINHRLAQDAIRTRALTLVVATTGSATLSATASGYARTSGSFVTDGFYKGMELVPTGFTQTTPGIVSAVTANALTIAGGRTAQTSGSGRELKVGLPLIRVYENEVPNPSTDVTRPYITEEFVPRKAKITTIPRRTGCRVEDGLSFWNWYGISGVGKDALSVSIDKLMALFTPATIISLSDGTTLDLPGGDAVIRSQGRRIDSWFVVTVQIAWRAYTRNAVAA